MKSRFKGRRIEAIEDRLDQLEAYFEEDLDLYETPEPALSVYQEELEGWKDWQQENKRFWKAFAKRTVDIESLAFYCLSDNVQKRLIN